MAVKEDLAERMRVALAGAGEVREVKMFGGLCFMLNGNMVAGTSKRGLLVRVGKDQYADALARGGAKRMEMTGRPKEGYIFVDHLPPKSRGYGIGLRSPLPSSRPSHPSSRNRSPDAPGTNNGTPAQRRHL